MASDSAAPERQLAWEARWRTPATAAAIGAGVALLGSAIYLRFVVLANTPTVGLLQGLQAGLSGAASPPVSPRAAVFEFVDHHVAGQVLAAALWTLGSCAMAAALLYLYGATKARRPELPAAARVLAVAGPVVAGLLGLSLAGQPGLVTEIASLVKIHDFVRGSDHSHHAVTQAAGGILTVLATVSLAGVLALGFAFVLIALNAMRVGLLTRFMGILGILSGVLFVVPLLGSTLPVVQGFWLVALGILFLGRSPSGMPMAWQTGRAEPWPSQQEVREQREAGRRERAGLPPPEAGPARSGPDPASAQAAPAPRVHPSSKKRRRKRRG